MAITRAQQVKQMLQDGGRIGFRIGSGEGKDVSGREYGGSKTSPGSGSKTGGGGDNRDRRRTEQYKEAPKKTIKSGKDFREFNQFKDAYEDKTFIGPTVNFARSIIPGNKKLREQFLKQKLKNPLISDFYENLDEDKKDDFNVAEGLAAVGYADYAADMGFPSLKYSGDVGGLNKFVTGEDEFGNTTYGYSRAPGGGGEGVGGQPIIPQTMMASAPAVDDYYGPGGNPFLNRTAFRLLADGGFLDDDDYVGGGIMDASGRQQYFLGKLVKSAKKAVKGVTRAVKKVAKSPLGKAALIGGLGYLTMGGAGGIGNFFGKGSFNPFLRKVGGDFAFSGLGSILSKAGLVSSAGGLTGMGKLALAGGLTAAPFLFGQGDEEEETQTFDRGQGLDIPGLRARGMRFDPTLIPTRFAGSKFQFAADGGRIGLSNGGISFREYLSKQGLDLDKLDLNTLSIMQRAYDRDVPNRPNKLADGGKPEPVAKKTMPLLDMGGKEMDLREEGGFVPIGRMEKADDVPARLSKNEFVFTADAVRNAGDGNVDKGAEVMYNMMKNLEAGGDVSEESQGLKGARRMFETSQRLEEVL